MPSPAMPTAETRMSRSTSRVARRTDAVEEVVDLLVELGVAGGAPP